jgi:hypothetical protein
MAAIAIGMAVAAIGTVAATVIAAAMAAVTVDERCGFCWSRMMSIFSAF